MAAPREREHLNFKSFADRRKTEYSLRFPFLTERQILAKLRKVWKSQKGSAASGSRKQEPASPFPSPAIQLPHGTHTLPTTADTKRASADLSPFDVDFDSTAHCTGQYSNKCTLTTHQPHASSDQMHVDNSRHRAPSVCRMCEQSVCEHDVAASTCTDAMATQRPPSLITQSRRQPLYSLENIHKNFTQKLTSQKCYKALQTSLARKSTSTASPNVSPCPGASCYRCTSHRKEAALGQCCVTNILQFPSEESLYDLGVSTGTTRTPIMADQMTGVDLSHTSRLEFPESATLSHEPHVPPATPEYHVCSPIVPAPHNPSSTVPLSQDAVNPKVAPLFLCSPIQPLPSPRAATPNTDKCPRNGARLVPSPPLASSTDAISTSSVSNTLCCCLTDASPSLCNEVIPRDTSDTLDTSDTSLTRSDANRTQLPPSSDGAPVAPRCGANARPHFHRRRRRVRSKHLWPLSNITTLPDGSVMEGVSCVSVDGRNVSPTVPSTQTDVASTLPNSVSCEDSRAPDLENKNRKMSASGFVVSPDNINSSTSHDPCHTTDGKTVDHRRSWEQIVPEHAIPLPQKGSLTYHPEHENSSTAKEDLMCDMFQLLTPDRPNVELCHTHQSTSHGVSSKRRVFRSASTEGDSNFYSMFIDESDIFM